MQWNPPMRPKWLTLFTKYMLVVVYDTSVGRAANT
jgi:hypothetical protein